MSKPFLDLFVVCVYSQLVNFSTRGNKVLDLILTDDDLLIHNIEPCPPIGCIKFFIDTSVVGKSAVQSGIPHVCTRYKWQHGDYASMNNYLANVDWNSLICFNSSAQSSWSALMREIQFAVEMFVHPTVFPVRTEIMLFIVSVDVLLWSENVLVESECYGRSYQ